MVDQAHDFLIASGKLQALCYKEEIESALRTPGMGGFELLALYDFPGQGTALVGVLDALWDPKGYITAEEFRRFCSSTVPLARLPRRVFTTDETLDAAIEVAHFGPKPLGKRIARHGSSRATTASPSRRAAAAARTIPVDNGARSARSRIPLRRRPLPPRGTGWSSAWKVPPIENDWDVWVYPPPAETSPPPGVTIAASARRPCPGGRSRPAGACCS